MPMSDGPPVPGGRTTLNPAFSLTPEELTLLSEEQFGTLLGAADRLRERLRAEQRRRVDAARRYDVLGRDATATCLAHRRLVRWLASPCWWYHGDVAAGEYSPPESRQCRPLLAVNSPIVVVPRRHFCPRHPAGGAG